MRPSPNQIAELKEKVRLRKYGKYLPRIKLQYIRGFKDQEIEFKFPVTALIGTNGGGKSTILGAAALAYKNIRPGQFFPKASIGDDSMADWKIEYEIVDKTVSGNTIITRSAKFAQQKWRRNDLVNRDVLYIPIQRTVPAGEISRLKKFISAQPSMLTLADIPEETKNFASAILGRDVHSYRVAYPKNEEIDVRRGNFIYIAETAEAGYSQFHFGAGEASVISVVDAIEKAPENTLVLIEEIENGLHPVATRLMVDYLLNVAHRKKLQILFTTHSQNALEQLPGEAIWACIESKTFSGRLDIETLRAIVGDIPKKLVIFVEDQFVKTWVEDAIRQYLTDIVGAVEVHAAGGYPHVVDVTRFHNDNPAVTVKAIAFVDGDVMGPDPDRPLPDFARKLGDTYPEQTVFQYIVANITDLTGLIKQRCLLNGFTEDRIKQVVEEVDRSMCDHHEIYRELGRRFNFASELRLREGLINIFNERNEQFWKEHVEFIQERCASIGGRGDA